MEGYLGPIANTVGNVSRVTGVEGSVRWFLGAGRRANSNSNLDGAGNSKKRRKVDSSGDTIMSVDSGIASGTATPSDSLDCFPSTPRSDRRLSTASTVDTLPAYDDLRSPVYTELVETPKPIPTTTSTALANAAWQHRLIMSTSGLSIAMSEESLRSLKYCLRWLKWANEHIARVIGALKTTLEQYDNTPDPDEVAQVQAEAGQQRNGMVGQSQQQTRIELAARINTLKGDVLKTLQDVVSTVSTYAGGALPENAKLLVRRHLTSLPQRFRVATMVDGDAEASERDSESAMKEGAQKMLVLAKEGLDMVTQISGVLDGTIVSAEDWCDRMGKRRKTSPDDEAPLLPQTNGDVKMAEEPGVQ